MLHQREGQGKISSPHLVKYFGEQKPPKMARCDLNWIIIFFSSISMHLEWKKWRNKLMGPFLPATPSLAKQGLKPYGSNLRHQTTFFGGKDFPLNVSPFHVILYKIIIPTVQESH